MDSTSGRAGICKSGESRLGLAPGWSEGEKRRQEIVETFVRYTMASRWGFMLG